MGVKDEKTCDRRELMYKVFIYLALKAKVSHEEEYAFLCIYAPGASMTPSTSSKDLAVK